MAGPMASQENTCLSWVGLSAARPTWRCSAIEAAPVAPPVSKALRHSTGNTGKATASPAPAVAAITLKPTGRLQAMPVGKAPGRQGQEDLGQREQRQQHAHRGFAVALAQRQQRRRHADAGHAGVQKDMSRDEPGQRGVQAAGHGRRFVPFGQRRQQGLCLRFRQRLHHLQRAAHLVGAGLRDLQRVGGLAHLLADLLDPAAVALELGLDRAQHLPHFGGLLLQRQGAKAHVQAVEHGQQRRRARPA